MGTLHGESGKTHYPDHAQHVSAGVREHVQLARDTYRIRLDCQPIAARIVPGQFVMLRFPGCNDPLLGRPLALYDTVLNAAGEPEALDIVYLALGKMTRRLARMRPGDTLETWGPLGNGFPAVPTEHLVMVAGGIGQTPFLALGHEYLGVKAYGSPPRRVERARRITLCYGARSRDYLAGVDDFEAAGMDVKVATDDGTAGHHGLVTALVRPVVEGSESTCRIVCCGPEPMLKATAELARQLDVACQVSLETPMACGIGICFSCVAKIRDAEGNWDYRRTCVEGPVFDADDVEL